MTRPRSMAVAAWGDFVSAALFIVFKIRNRGYEALEEVVEFRKLMDLPSSEPSTEPEESESDDRASAPSSGLSWGTVIERSRF